MTSNVLHYSNAHFDITTISRFPNSIVKHNDIFFESLMRTKQTLTEITLTFHHLNVLLNLLDDEKNINLIENYQINILYIHT